MEELRKEIERRRTFAIISHPDAGKTTLTEKLLLYGGAIRLAGSVKSRKAKNYAVSDWMEIEKQRGISVTSSVMQFDYDGYCINILDTPGHQDFSEDTYRTLMAADSAVMVVDAAKGIEDQTRKLFNVASLRNIPIFTIINKMDREAKDPFALMEDIENELGIKTYPMNWPIGSGKDFRGVYERASSSIQVFSSEGKHGQSTVNSVRGSVNDPVFVDLIGESFHDQLKDDIELLDMAGNEFDMGEVLKGNLSPVFFASALTNFGIEPFLKSFLEMTSPPLPRETSEGQEIDVFSDLRLRLQDPGEHESSASRQDRLHQNLLRQVQKRNGSLPLSGKEQDQAFPAHTVPGSGQRSCGRSLCRRHHRCLRPGHLLHR